MASTSCPSSSVPTHYEYDVFLSFRGEDTRNSFTDHLYKELHQAGIRTFRDDNDIHEGEELKPEIERSITESRASIIVFSENFANSSWCLDELCLILEQKRKHNHFILPVFYKVEPSDIRNQRGSFMIGVKEGVEGTKWTHDNVKRWKIALTKVSNLKGMVVSGYETAFISNIVQKIYDELDLKLLSTPTDLTGIETRAEVINSWLKDNQNGSPVLSICGMGGSGKTTLAKYIYSTNKKNFESSSFLEEYKNHHRGDLLHLQKQLLRDVSKNSIMISNVSEGTFQIEKAIRVKKVLIVIDDIDDPDILSTLFGTKVFPTQSKIVITTRLINIDTWFGSISRGCHIHKVTLLNDVESLELLSHHAFGSKVPMEGFKELAVQLAQYCGGNPLALKVLGSSLPVSAHDQRTRNEMTEIWRSRMNALNSLNGDLDHKIQVVLQKSFESLPYESNKELFLHIACLFVGQKAHRVAEILENDWHAKSGIMTLVNRCLLTVPTDTQNLTMHQLLQDMARKIVREESKDPAKRSRVWHHDESYRLLKRGDGSETIEALSLDMGEVEQGMTTSESFKTSSLVKMKNLKLLELYHVELSGSYENFPELTWLSWNGCNLKAIPTGLFSSRLVAIHMKHSDLENFEPPMVLNSLKILDLAASYKLTSICLHGLPKLENLILWHCTSLTHVCKTIGDLKNLYFLSLQMCPKLWKASSNQQPLFSLPKSLSQLNLIGNPFEMLPSYIDLKMLRELHLGRCTNLKALSCLPVTLEVLTVDWCSSLEKITFQSTRFTLQVFNYEGCFKLCEIQGLFKLESIAKLDEVDLGDMQWIKVYQDHKVDLVGDTITNGRSWNIQMLYEYGIRSIYLQGIKDQSMMTHEYRSSSGFLNFHVPVHPKKHRIKGLYVTLLYRTSGKNGDIMVPPFIKIRNKSKGLTWVYSPVVYCKPRVDNIDVVWLSYWPIGNALDAGDEVLLNILLDRDMMMTRGCGASIVYMENGEVEIEEKCQVIKWKEVIGGDLSEFEVTKGGYYLCRCDIFKSQTPDLFKLLFGDNIEHTDSRRWRTSSHLEPAVYHTVNTFRNYDGRKIEVELGVSFNNESETDKIEKGVYGVVGVEHVSTYKEVGRLIVCGRFDPQKVAMRVREFEKIVQVLRYITLEI